MVLKMSKPSGLNRYFKPAPKAEPTPEPPKRAPSPPHEYTLIDNETIAFLVMFRSRFSDAFPKSLPHYGPQDIERGVQGDLPDEQVERLLCALLGMVLNRKKDVESVTPKKTLTSRRTYIATMANGQLTDVDTMDEHSKTLSLPTKANGWQCGRV